MASEDSTNSFTPGDTKILMCILKNLEGDLQADWNAVATELGYKDASIARTRWSQIKRKKIKGDSPKAAKGTPRKRKDSGTGGGDDEEGVESPTAKKRGRKAKGKNAKPKADDGDGDGDDANVKGAAIVKEEQLDEDAGAMESIEAAGREADP
ncbi:hypothetical protein BAUCODRAFT_147197 [Baudoinia panamericana UAMH 10762]|uniref:Myb-like DNA-binding domain-containing protein n=1 Tax=Baudoinia panamericana (strain UAMH 10762) TaxID=717646 RepID=M2LRF5_BAUPA|nr:uncharacterized protein BAUCODRAFT_147197 [Baudoinia panamericana UAMH 10762]EMC97012.1 hypothetical protein BAUCODRAFT_147197 [Baudoinia panamericana UAMH 10762]